MTKFIVRMSYEYSLVIEAETEDEAFEIGCDADIQEFSVAKSELEIEPYEE